jgi:hypothetical protein
MIVEIMQKTVKAPQIEKLIKKDHENKWVAFSADYKKIVDYAKSLRELQKKVGKTKVVYLKVFPTDVVLAP